MCEWVSGKEEGGGVSVQTFCVFYSHFESFEQERKLKTFCWFVLAFEKLQHTKKTDNGEFLAQK